MRKQIIATAVVALIFAGNVSAQEIEKMMLLNTAVFQQQFLKINTRVLICC